MCASVLERPDVRNFLRGVLIIVAAAFMISPAYLNYEIFNTLHFQLVVSMSISLMLFAIGLVTFILVMGKEAFQGKEQAQ